MSYYEYLRKTYIIEIRFVSILTFFTSLSIYLIGGDLPVLLLGSIGSLLIFAQTLLLIRKKNITTFHSLLAPRIIYASVAYVLIIAIPIVLPEIIFEYLLLVPISLSLLSIHPFFTEKAKNRALLLSAITGAVLIYFEYSQGAYEQALGIENYIFLIYITALVYFIIYVADRGNKASRKKLAESNAKLQEQLSSTNEANAKIDNINTKLNVEFRNLLSDIEANFDLISHNTSNDNVRKISEEGQDDIKSLYTFMENFANHRKIDASLINYQQVDINIELS